MIVLIKFFAAANFQEVEVFLDNDVGLLSPFQHLKSLVQFNNISITTVLGLSFPFSSTNVDKFSFSV